MARILAIDYGGKRTGIAVTDPLKIIASGLTTIATQELMPWLKKYFATEEVETVIIGLPVNWDESDTDVTHLVRHFVQGFRKNFPSLPIVEIDERFSSKMASKAISGMGLSKKKRQSKELIDEVAATLMLQEYLNR